MFDEQGRQIFRGQEALDRFAESLGSRLREAHKLHYKTTFQNLPISIENRKGSFRRGVGDDGEEWETKMKHPYGYIRGTEGPDGDAVDVFVGPDENAAYAYVVHSNNPETGEFDEDKVMLGFASSKRAKEVFLQHYDDPKFFGGIDSIPMWRFSEKVFIKKHTLKKLVASVRESNPIPKHVGATGLDQSMKKAILGHHQDQMVNPEVRESREGPFASLQVPEDMLEEIREGGPGSGPHEGLTPKRAAIKAAEDKHQETSAKMTAIRKRYKAEGKQFIGQPDYEEAAEKSMQAFEELERVRRKYGVRESRTFESRLGSFLQESRKPGTYYARELARYDTDAEEADLDLIRESFEGRVDFPRTKRHGQLGMGYFHEKIDRAKRVVIKPARGKRLTAGVFSEAKHAIKRGIPVYGIHKGRLRRVKNVEALGHPNKEGHFGRVIYRKRRK